MTVIKINPMKRSQLLWRNLKLLHEKELNMYPQRMIYSVLCGNRQNLGSTKFRVKSKNLYLSPDGTRDKCLIFH